MDFIGCSLFGLEVELFRDEDELFDLTVSKATASWSPCASRLSPDAFDVFKSNEDGVLGVFVAPKDANAPEPRPKAEEALAEGEETFVERGEIALKGLERP